MLIDPNDIEKLSEILHRAGQKVVFTNGCFDILHAGHVVLFGEKTAETIIAKVRPDVYVKGGDYTLETLPEAKIVQSYGGRVEFVQMVAGRSTTNVIEKIKKMEG